MCAGAIPAREERRKCSKKSSGSCRSGRSASARSCSERSALPMRCTRRWCCASGPTRSSCRRRAAPTPMPCSPCPRCASGSKRRNARPRLFRSSTWPSEDVRRRRGGARRIAGPAFEGQGSRRRRRDARGDGPPRLQARRQGFSGVFAPRDARGARARAHRAQERPRLQGLHGACRAGGHARRRPEAARPHHQRHGEGRGRHADRSVRRPPRPEGRGAAPRERGLCRGPGADPACRALCRALRFPGGRRNHGTHEGDGEVGRSRHPGPRARVAGILARAGRVASGAHVRSAGGLRPAATAAPGAESHPEKTVRLGRGTLRAARVAAEGIRSQCPVRAPASAGRRTRAGAPGVPQSAGVACRALGFAGGIARAAEARRRLPAPGALQGSARSRQAGRSCRRCCACPARARRRGHGGRRRHCRKSRLSVRDTGPGRRCPRPRHHPGAVRFHLSSLARNLLAGLRLALFLPVRAFDYRVSALDYVLLVLFDFVAWVAVTAALAGFGGDFNLSAIPIYLASVSLVLGAALLVALAYGAAEKLLSVAVALSASEPWFELVVLVVPTVSAASGHGEVVLWIFLGWTLMTSVRAIAVVMGTRRPQLYQGALAVGAMIAIAFFAFPETDVWLPGAEQDEAAGAGLADERAFHLQGQLIERSLADLRRGRSGVPELYFVGFAPDGSQDVFLREMRYVKRLFDERFGTAGRSIALASSRDALEEFPIGSVTNLARALNRVGEAMN